MAFSARRAKYWSSWLQWKTGHGGPFIVGMVGNPRRISPVLTSHTIVERGFFRSSGTSGELQCKRRRSWVSQSDKAVPLRWFWSYFFVFFLLLSLSLFARSLSPLPQISSSQKRQTY